MLTLAFNIQPVEANGTIYIRADGSIDPPTANITTADYVTYTFTGNISDSIVIERNNMTLDGAGYTVYGHGGGSGRGIDLSGRSNVTIKDMIIRAFDHGIYLSGSLNNSIVGNNITANGWNGISLYESSNNSIFGNHLTANYEWGIHLYASSNYNSIFGNSISGERTYGPHGINGLYLINSSNNNIFGNEITNYSLGIHQDSSSNNKAYHNNFIDNDVQAGADNPSNIWDNGYPSGGNYWSDYIGVDANSDGIGDTPYIIDENNVDHCPLIHPYGSIRNLDTNLTYLTIQSAINAPETLSGHTISVRNGTYYENVIVNKTVTFVGESKERTIINGEGAGNTITVSANDVVIRGFTVTNSGGAYPDSGIFLNGVKNTIITDNNVTGNDGHGIFVMWGSNNSVLNNSVTYNAQHGIRIDGTEAQAIIANNTIEYNQPDGIFLYVAYDVLIENNTVSNNKQCGITPQGGSMNTTIRYNLITRNGWHGVFFIGSNNSLVKANIINDNGFSGIELLVSSNDSIVENSITNNTKGIYVYSSSNNSIVGNSVTASNGLGISLVDLSDGNSIVGNQVIANDENGVYLYRSSGNIICGNRVTANVGTGIYLHDSSRQRIFGNNIEDNSNGIWLWGSSAYNTIEENTITANIERGIGLYESSDNTIFHNNFVNNIDHVMVYGLGYANHWDNGFEGNYWSDYAGADLNHDGIGDTPYTIDADNQDNYPLMGMFSSFNVTWGDTTWQTEIISNSTITEFTFEQSLKRISFNISGPSSTIGFYRLLIPRALLDGPFTVTVDGISVSYTRWLNVTHTYVYCAHTHSSHQIQITGTTTVPELPEALVPINVQVDVGTIHFKGELAEFYTQTAYEGTAVNATSLEATLYKPDGATELLTSQPIALGLYKTTFLIPANASAGTYALVIKATYIKTVGPTTFETTGTSFKTFVLSPTLTSWNAWLTNIKDDIATIKTDIGQIKISLTAINATLSSIDGTTAEIKTSVGIIKADLTTIDLKVTAINGTTATIQTTLGTIQGNITSINGNIATIQTNIGTIKADISAIQGTQETSMIPLYATLTLAVIAIVGLAVIIALLRRKKTT
jgi:parallel beta-helix repeat protein